MTYNDPEIFAEWLRSIKPRLDAGEQVEVFPGGYVTGGTRVEMLGETRTLREWCGDSAAVAVVAMRKMLTVPPERRPDLKYLWMMACAERERERVTRAFMLPAYLLGPEPKTTAMVLYRRQS